MLTKHMEIELEAIINSLGYLDGNWYKKEPDCEQSIQGLIRFLRHDSSDNCPIRRKLGCSGIVENDLVPAIRCFPEDKGLFDVAIRLLLNLSQPAVLCFRDGKVPDDKTTLSQYTDVVHYLQTSKRAFTDKEFMVVLTRHMKTFLETEWANQDEEDRLVAERVLLLIRNVLHIPNPAEDKHKTQLNTTVQDHLILALSDSGMMDMLLFIAENKEQNNWHLFVLEIFSLMFREHIAKEIAQSGEERSQQEAATEKAQLARMVASNTAKKQAQLLKLSTRHSRFAGSYQIHGLKAIDPDNDAVSSKVVKDPNRLEWLHDRKTGKRTPKNRLPLITTDLHHRSALNVRLALRDISVKFLQKGYNPFMRSAKYLINRNKDLVGTARGSQDDSYFLWGLRFFLEFCRTSNMSLDLVKESLTYQSFHYVQTQMENYLEMATTDKTEAKLWGERARLGIRAYRELLLSMQEMMRRPKWQDRVEEIEKYIFYQTEYRDLCLSLLKRYSPVFLSNNYLHELIEATHLYLRLLEKYCSSSGGKFKVLKRRKKAKRKPKKKQSEKKGEGSGEGGEVGGAEGEGERVWGEEELEEVWERVTPDLCSLLQGHGDIPSNAVPFDATMEVDEETHMKVASCRIQKALREERVGDAVALYRAARELWSESGIFGSSSMEPEEEFMELKEFLTTPMEQLEKTNQTNNEVGNGEQQIEDAAEEAAGVEEDVFGDGNEEELSEEEEEREDYVETETDFNFRDYLHRLARHDVLKWYVSVLKDFDKNSANLNHAVIKLLHRVAFDLGMAPLLFQASLFRTLQKIGNYKGYMEGSSELYGFSRRLIRAFMDLSTTNKKLFVEVFFWKNAKISYELEYGYGSSAEMVKSSKGLPLWSEDLELEVRERYEEFQMMEEKPEGVDLLDYIAHNISKERSQKQVRKHLREMGLEVPKTKSKSHRPPRSRLPPADPEHMDEIVGLVADGFGETTDFDEMIQIDPEVLEAGKKYLSNNTPLDDTDLHEEGAKSKKLKKKKKAKRQDWLALGSDVSAGESGSSEENEESASGSDSSSDAENLTSRLNKVAQEADDSDEEEEEVLSFSQALKKLKEKRQKIRPPAKSTKATSPLTEREPEHQSENDNPTPSGGSTTPSSRFLLIEEDDEKENEKQLETEKNKKLEKRKRKRIVSSDSEDDEDIRGKSSTTTTIAMDEEMRDTRQDPPSDRNTCSVPRDDCSEENNESTEEDGGFAPAKEVSVSVGKEAVSVRRRRRIISDSDSD